jgi:hypothetical protein
MTQHAASSLRAYIQELLPRLGRLIEEISKHPENSSIDTDLLRRKLEEVLSSEERGKGSSFIGVLGVLYGLGLIGVNHEGKITIVSRHANFALASLSKFLLSATQVADKPIDELEKDYLVKLTGALEKIRQEKVDNSAPIHHRRIVNIAIKSRQIRHGKMQDVYLHVYHPGWKEYHLIGLSHKDNSKTDEEIAVKALEKQMGLLSNQYVLSAIGPEHTIKKQSLTSGAYTEYTYKLYITQEIKTKLDLKKIKDGQFDVSRFRWFTWDEIKRLESDHGERIMFSTPELLSDYHSSLPVSAKRAEDVRQKANLFLEITERFTYAQIGITIMALLLIPTLKIVPSIFEWLGKPSPLLDNFANIADILSIILPASLAGIIIAVLRR